MAVLPTDPNSRFASLRQVISGGAAVTGVALLITAIVETASSQLSLFHAIYIIHILTFILGIVIAPGGAYKTASKIAIFIRFNIWEIRTLCVEQCSETLPDATIISTWLRAIWMAALAMGMALCILTVIPFVFARGTLNHQVLAMKILKILVSVYGVVMYVRDVQL
ncbi:hypothetical protein JOM56_004955 [Amanita muscaria]